MDSRSREETPRGAGRATARASGSRDEACPRTPAETVICRHRRCAVESAESRIPAGRPISLPGRTRATRAPPRDRALLSTPGPAPRPGPGAQRSGLAGDEPWGLAEQQPYWPSEVLFGNPDSELESQPVGNDLTGAPRRSLAGDGLDRASLPAWIILSRTRIR